MTTTATTLSYRIVLDGHRPRGVGRDTLSMAGAIVYGLDGRVISTTDSYDGEHDLVLLEIPAEYAADLEAGLEDDAEVLSFGERG